MNKLMAVIKNQPLDYTGLFFTCFSIVLGGIVRFYPILLSDFPLNDGGLFLQMTRDLLNNHFSLPAFTTYNGGGIPFSYPPLAFYLMAFLQRFFSIDIIDQLHYIPPFISTLAVLALYFLSRKITSSKEISIFATFAYALMPHSFVWLIMGGGITRSLGILFGIMAIMFVWEMFHEPKQSNLLLSILFCSLTIYSHPEIAWFVLLTSLLLGLWFGLNKKGILNAGLTIIGVLLLTSPWWIALIQRFGLSIFLNGFQTGGFFNLSILLFYFTGESFSTIFAIVALVGLFAEIARRKFFLFVWLIVIAIFSARSGQLLATIPGAFLFGLGMCNVLFPGLINFKKAIIEENSGLEIIFRERISKIAFTVILVYGLISAMILPHMEHTALKSVSQKDRQAMEWVTQNTPEESGFVVLSGEQSWFSDPISEWFPTLTRRVSITTVQGSEWLADEQFQKKVDPYRNLQTCVVDDLRCVMNWADEYGSSYSYIYLSNSSIGEEINLGSNANSSAPSDQFQLVYENPGVRIYHIQDTP